MNDDRHALTASVRRAPSRFGGIVHRFSFIVSLCLAGCAPRTWCVPTTCPSHPDKTRISCCKETNLLGIDSYSTIPPGAIPQPNGTYVHAWEERMATAAAADRFVIYLNEWYMGGPELGPCGFGHLAEIARHLPAAPFPVVVQPCGDEMLNQMHRQMVVHYLVEHGIGDAETRVIVVCPKAEGLFGPEAVQAYQRLQSNTQSGGVSGGSPVSGFQGSFLGSLGGGFSY
jgi:hypothetical protein